MRRHLDGRTRFCEPMWVALPSQQAPFVGDSGWCTRFCGSSQHGKDVEAYLFLRGFLQGKTASGICALQHEAYPFLRGARAMLCGYLSARLHVDAPLIWRRRRIAARRQIKGVPISADVVVTRRRQICARRTHFCVVADVSGAPSPRCAYPFLRKGSAGGPGLRRGKAYLFLRAGRFETGGRAPGLAHGTGERDERQACASGEPGAACRRERPKNKKPRRGGVFPLRGAHVARHLATLTAG